MQPYTLCIPENYDDSGKYALIAALHGMYAADYKLVSDLALSRLYDFIIVAPFARGNSYFLDTGEKDVLDVMDRIISSYPINMDKGYITGISMGGLQPSPA